MKAAERGIKNTQYGANTIQYNTIQCYKDQNFVRFLAFIKKGFGQLR
jgi:hypothetical protein